MGYCLDRRDEMEAYEEVENFLERLMGVLGHADRTIANKLLRCPCCGVVGRD